MCLAPLAAAGEGVAMREPAAAAAAAAAAAERAQEQGQGIHTGTLGGHFLKMPPKSLLNVKI